MTWIILCTGFGHSDQHHSGPHSTIAVLRYRRRASLPAAIRTGAGRAHFSQGEHTNAQDDAQ